MSTSFAEASVPLRWALLPRAYYSAPIRDFLAADDAAILGVLTANSEFAVDLTQRDAWMAQTTILRQAMAGLDGVLWLEFTIPRMGHRADAVLIVGATILVIEFKIGASEVSRADLHQAWDYALDLKNFHKGSHAAFIAPILVASECPERPPDAPAMAPDGVFEPTGCNAAALRRQIDACLLAVPAATPLDIAEWAATPYCPTPTIIEAAQALYAQHSVTAIARNDAGAKNLTLTSARLDELVAMAQRERRKVICMVTGVPGAGKTLVGLNVATQHSDRSEPYHAVFLSGTGPLVAVQREALTRDAVERRRPEKVRKGEVRESVKAFIQNVHHFRDEALRDSGPPADHVVIFDEAQRAWDLEQTARFMRSKRKQEGFAMSEPEFLISYLDRHQDWALVVCLVGGGQEIHTGEAGMGAWIEALTRRFPHWEVLLSNEITDSEYALEQHLPLLEGRGRVTFDDALHLAVPMRSFRSDRVSRFVKELLDCDADAARHSFAQLARRYPIALTRSLQSAKQWVREHARGNERYGLVASSGAQRLKPHAIDVRVEVDPIHWFLNSRDDTRSSYYLEDAATEFQVQGLELDWTCVTWDGDLRYHAGDWRYHDFCGAAWRKIHKDGRRTYLRNAYRVLLTRARQGMVIFVPRGDEADATRAPEFYDGTYEYLRSLGLPLLHA